MLEEARSLGESLSRKRLTEVPDSDGTGRCCKVNAAQALHLCLVVFGLVHEEGHRRVNSVLHEHAHAAANDRITFNEARVWALGSASVYCQSRSHAIKSVGDILNLAIVPSDIDPPLSHDLSGTASFSESASCTKEQQW